MSLISVKGLTFSYDGSYENVFENVSFEIDTDWKLGFIGRNGRGKTTFLNLLMGRYDYSGIIASSVTFDYFPFDVADMSAATIDVIEEMLPGFRMWELRRELNLIEIDEGVLYRQFDTLSPGERTKVMLAALFLKENNFLLIDEPTNHLDAEARNRVMRYLNTKKGFILVSHDRAFLDGCTDHVLSINRADITVTTGNFSVWDSNRRLLEMHENSCNERLMNEISRLDRASKRASEWSDKVESTKIGDHVLDRGAVGHKAAKMMKRAKSIEKRRENAADEKRELLKNVERNDAIAVHPLLYRNDVLAQGVDVAVKYGENTVFEKLCFEVRRGERICISGKNGCGKSSLIKLVTGDLEPSQGTVRRGSGLKMSYIPQDSSFLTGTISEYAALRQIDLSLMLTILRKLDFSRALFERDMADYSAGQRKKVLIAASLCENAHLYVWDEPLNYVDILSRMQIESLILEGKPTMLFIEHDKAFASNVATREVTLE